jgi:hypothetical protein
MVYAVLALAVSAIGGTQVAPCLAGTAPDIQAACHERWLAERGLALQLVDTPLPAITVFLLLTGLTAWIGRLRT